MSKILTFGEIIWDIFGEERHIGGAGLNFAAHAARCGAESSLLSAVGRDALGENALSALSASLVDTEHIQKKERPTGTCLVTLDKSGIPSYHVTEGTAYDAITLSEEDIGRLRCERFDVLCFGTLIQRSPTSRAALRKLCESLSFEEIVCDINLRDGCYDKDSILFCLNHATILKLSDEEEPILREMGLYKVKKPMPHTIATAIAAKFPGIKTVLLTCGAKGCLCYSAETKTAYFKKAEAVTVASTVGAGDSFLAGFVVTRLSGHGDEAATRFASALSGFVVSRTEAVPAYSVRNGRISPTLPIFDTHVHSDNSHDGKNTVDALAESYIAMGAGAFTVTDHCDLRVFDEMRTEERFTKTLADIRAAKEKYGDKINILFGVEIGEAPEHPEKTKKFLSHYDFDAIIGSVHTVRCKELSDYTAKIDFGRLSEEALHTYISFYFDEVKEMLCATPCHILGHLTLPMRYINHKYGRGISLAPYADKIEEILAYIIAHNIALEINTSGDGYFMPEEDIVKAYKDMGGYLITLGSDAHEAKNTAKNFGRVIEMLRHLGFDAYYYFEKGKSQKCEI